MSARGPLAAVARGVHTLGSAARHEVFAVVPREVKDGAKATLAGARRLAPASVARVAERAARRPPATPEELAAARRDRPGAPPTDVRLWVAPANFAGQGHEWARAVRRLPGVGARAMNVAGPLRFPTDYEVPAAVYRDLGWQREQRDALAAYTHTIFGALVVAGMFLLGISWAEDQGGGEDGAGSDDGEHPA